VIGLVAKYVVLAPVVDDGQGVLAVVMAVNVVIALAYYLRLLVISLSPASRWPRRRRPSAHASPWDSASPP
jgi:NADH-quinone oxidoreductase subunit N